MPKVFISYRRADSKHAAGRIGDYLIESFGRENVIKDVDSIPLGHDFRVELTRLIPKADVLLAIIGSSWLNAADAQGRRLDNEADWVRVEIETALNLNIPVVPILISDAQMPKAEELPEALAPLARLSGTRIGAEHTFRHDISLLIRALEKTLSNTTMDAIVVSPENSAPGSAPALDVLVAEFVASGTPPSPPVQARPRPAPSPWTLLRWGCAVTAIMFLGFFGLVVIIAMLHEEPPPAFDHKQLEDLSKYKPYMPPNLEGIFPKDFQLPPNPANSGVNPWEGTEPESPSPFSPGNSPSPFSPNGSLPGASPFEKGNSFPEASPPPEN